MSNAPVPMLPIDSRIYVFQSKYFYCKVSNTPVPILPIDTRSCVYQSKYIYCKVSNTPVTILPIDSRIYAASVRHTYVFNTYESNVVLRYTGVPFVDVKPGLSFRIYGVSRRTSEVTRVSTVYVLQTCFVRFAALLYV